jgi:hypothetical protein
MASRAGTPNLPAESGKFVVGYLKEKNACNFIYFWFEVGATAKKYWMSF